MNTLALKNYPGFRQWIQVVGAAVLAALVSYQFVSSEQAQLWVALIAAVLPPALSALNSPSGIRTALYSVVGIVQALIISYNLATDAQVAPVVNIILAIVSASVAVTHTPTPAAADTSAG